MTRFSLPSLLAVATILATNVSGCSLFFPSQETPPSSTAPIWTLHPVRVDSVGYLSGREKVATVVLPPGTTMIADPSAEVRSAATDAPIWSCTLTGPQTDADTNNVYYLADFTGFTAEGDYILAVPGLKIGSDEARSAPFHIGLDVFRDALTRSMLGLYGQRCGTSVTIKLDGNTWTHGACHQNDAYLKYLTGETTKQPSVGGWHDAGDYGKYVTNGAFTVGMLLTAWDHFQPLLSTLAVPSIPKDGSLPDFLAEVKWELDWLLTTEGADGAVSHKVTALGFEGFVMPELDVQQRYYTAVGTAATADVVGALAQAYRIYRPYDPTSADAYLAAARRGYDYLTKNAGRPVPKSDSSGNICATADCKTVFTTGSYGQISDASNRLWAAAELWEATGEAPFLTDLEAAIGVPGVDRNFDWDNVRNLGLFTYLLSTREGRDPALLAGLTANAIAVGDSLAMAAQAAPFGRALGGYWWGSNGAVARTAMNLWVANQLKPDPKYLDAIAMQLDHLLGRNIYDRTQVTDVGYHPPLRPHHRPSISDTVIAAWPGLLVGGTDKGPSAWVDDQTIYSVNEVAINWIGAFVYATAALTPPAASSAAP